MVFGIDLGTRFSAVAATKQQGVDMVCNGMSKRETNSFVSYSHDGERHIGEAAYDRLLRYSSQTVGHIKQLIGLKASDPHAQEILTHMTCNTVTDDAGYIMLQIEHEADKILCLYPEQVLAALIHELASYVEADEQAGAGKRHASRECGITVPAWFTPDQRTRVLQATTAAQVECVALMNETTAACVHYGIYRTPQLPETDTEARTVAFVDIGYAGTTVSIARFWKQHCRILSHSWDRTLGASQVDLQLLNVVALEASKKLGCCVENLLGNQRSRLRLLKACDRTKDLLSANQEIILSCENLMDVDFTMMMKRVDLEEMIQPLCSRIHTLVGKALHEAGLEASDVGTVEVIGGGSRIPVFKAAIAQAFGRTEISTTLNASEAIALGCAITAASFSKTVRVRPFTIQELPLCPTQIAFHSDITKYPVQLDWLPGINKVVNLLTPRDRAPKVIELTFMRQSAFEFYAIPNPHIAAQRFSDTSDPNVDLLFGHWKIGDPPASVAKDITKIKVRFNLALSGLLEVTEAAAIEVKEVVQKPVKKKRDPEPSEGDEHPQEKEEEEVKGEPVMKKVESRIGLTATSVTSLGLSPEAFLRMIRIQSDHVSLDRRRRHEAELRNELESYILANRSEMADPSEGLMNYIAETSRNRFIVLANKTEQWLYDEGQTANWELLTERLSILKGMADPARVRMRSEGVVEFAALSSIQKLRDLNQEIVNHFTNNPPVPPISPEDVQKVQQHCSEALEWCTQSITTFQQRDKTVDADLTEAKFESKPQDILKEYQQLLAKKPKVEENEKE